MLDYAPYILLITLLFIGSLLEVLGFRKDQMKFVRWGILASLLTFVGLRYNTGADWYLYIKEFTAISLEGEDIMQWESGFVLLNRIVSVIFGNYYVLQFLATLFLLYSINKLYSKYSEFPIFCILIFTFLFLPNIMMAQVRQSIALAISMLGMRYIFDRSFIRFTLVLYLACMFHMSAIIVFPLYFLNSRISKTLSLSLLLLFQIIVFYPSIIVTLVLNISPLLPSRLGNLVDVYVNSIFAKKAEFGSGLYYIASVILCAIVIIFGKSDNDKLVFRNALLLAFLFSAIAKSMVILDRFVPYFYALGIISIANIVGSQKDKVHVNNVRSLFFMFCILFYGYTFMRFYKDTGISELTGRPANYSYVPYYNLISYPPEAEKRLDWIQKN